LEQYATAGREQAEARSNYSFRMNLRANELIQNGEYPEAVSIAWRIFELNKNVNNTEVGVLSDALRKWGEACELGSEKYPKDEAKALKLMKGAAHWGNKVAQETLKSRRVKYDSRESKSDGWVFFLGIASGLGVSFFVSNLLNLQSVFFLLRWLVRIVAFFVGLIVPFANLREEFKKFSLTLEPLRLYPSPKKPPILLRIALLVIALFGWASWALPKFLPIHL
jgi:hypothetical protein